MKYNLVSASLGFNLLIPTSLQARDRLSQFGKLTNLDFDQHYTDRLTNVNDLFHREIEVVLSKYEPPCDDSSSKGSVAY